MVRGAIAFEEGAPAFRGATVYIRLEDVTEADAPSRLVAQETLQGIGGPPRGGQISFELTTAGIQIDERASYNISVLVDLDGDGRPSRGDFCSMQSYPVLTHSYPSEVVVQVRRVGSAH